MLNKKLKRSILGSDTFICIIGKRGTSMTSIVHPLCKYYLKKDVRKH